MKLSPDFDPKRGCLALNLECQLLSKYFDVFESCFYNIPNNERLGIERSGDCSVKILLPALESEAFSNLEMKLGNKMPANIHSVAVNTDDMKEINDAIYKFLNTSLSKELKSTEFIPLEGYSWDSMREDIKEAVKNKRSFCIIKDYNEYLSMQKDNKYVFHQCILEYGTEEYADAAIMIYLDEQQEMRELYNPQLELVDWC